MRVVRNEEFIKKRTQFTQRGTLIGMVLLLISVVILGRYPLPSWGFLIVGFVMAMASVRVGNRYILPPRPDTTLDKVLKGLGGKYVLYHYVQPAEHLLLTPNGLVAIKTCRQRGEIVVRGARWQHRPLWQRLRVLFGEFGLGNPARELRAEMAATVKALPHLQKEGAVPFEGAVVFYAGKTRLNVKDPEMPVVLAEDLKATVRTMAESHPALSTRAYKALAAALQGEATEVKEEAGAEAGA